jgi:hypothetical protein
MSRQMIVSGLQLQPLTAGLVIQGETRLEQF